jgi:DNA-binding NarL/FixJ family response regulator
VSEVIRLVIADDHPIVLDGLESVLRLAPDMVVSARCVNGDEALDAVRAHRPDVLVLDIRMSRLDGFQVLRELAGDEGIATRVIILSAALSDDDVLAALRLGARGILPKEVAAEHVVEAIRSVHGGERWVEPRIAARLLGTAARAAPGDATDELTPREAELVALVASGLRNKEIASALSITEGTVKLHLHRIFRKLKVQSRLQLALYGRPRPGMPRE